MLSIENAVADGYERAVLQARMFSYPDAHRYRVGPNYFQLPPNRPTNTVYAPYVRDGPGTMNGNYGSDPDYVFSELRPVSQSKRVQIPLQEHWDGKVSSFATKLSDNDFVQARNLWQIICKEEKGKEHFLYNIIPTLQDIPATLRKEVLSKSYPPMRERYAYKRWKANGRAEYFGRVDPSLQKCLEEDLAKHS